MYIYDHQVRTMTMEMLLAVLLIQGRNWSMEPIWKGSLILHLTVQHLYPQLTHQHTKLSSMAIQPLLIHIIKEHTQETLRKETPIIYQITVQCSLKIQTIYPLLVHQHTRKSWNKMQPELFHIIQEHTHKAMRNGLSII